jgi:hypothetical protein
MTWVQVYEGDGVDHRTVGGPFLIRLLFEGRPVSYYLRRGEQSFTLSEDYPRERFCASSAAAQYAAFFTQRHAAQKVVDGIDVGDSGYTLAVEGIENGDQGPIFPLPTWRVAVNAPGRVAEWLSKGGKGWTASRPGKPPTTFHLNDYAVFDTKREADECAFALACDYRFEHACAEMVPWSMS